MNNHPEKAIDIESAIFAKTGRRFPKFATRWMSRFIHLDFINEFLVQGHEGQAFYEKALAYLDISVEAEGLDNIGKVPDGTKLTFVSNHPLGGVDGLGLVSLIGRRCNGNVKLLVNDFLMNIEAIASDSIPVNKTGTQARDLPGKISGIYKSDSHVLIFPSGKCSRRKNGVIQDPEWSKSFITKSMESGRWIIPIHFIGRNSNRFYFIDGLCRILGIKTNVAMFFLPDEMYKSRHGKFRAVFGNPIPPSRFDNSKTAFEWAQTIREETYQL